MRIRKLFGWLRLVPLWVGFMSGSFSIIREAVILFSDNPNPIWQRNLFWSCVWITFVIAMVAAWYLTYQELLEEKAKNDSPEIKGEIQEVHSMRTLQMGVPDENKRIDHYLTIKAHLVNRRQPTTIENFQLLVKTG